MTCPHSSALRRVVSEPGKGGACAPRPPPARIGPPVSPADASSGEIRGVVDEQMRLVTRVWRTPVRGLGPDRPDGTPRGSLASIQKGDPDRQKDPVRVRRPLDTPLPRRQAAARRVHGDVRLHREPQRRVGQRGARRPARANGLQRSRSARTRPTPHAHLGTLFRPGRRLEAHVVAGARSARTGRRSISADFHRTSEPSTASGEVIDIDDSRTVSLSDRADSDSSTRPWPPSATHTSGDPSGEQMGWSRGALVRRPDWRSSPSAGRPIRLTWLTSLSASRSSPASACPA